MAQDDMIQKDIMSITTLAMQVEDVREVCRTLATIVVSEVKRAS